MFMVQIIEHGRRNIYNANMLNHDDKSILSERLEALAKKADRLSQDEILRQILDAHLEASKPLDQRKNVKDSSSLSLEIKGDSIKDKISFLHLSNTWPGTVKVVESDLECETLYLYSSSFSTDTKKVIAKYFIMPASYYTKSVWDVVTAEQFIAASEPDEGFRVKYNDDNWGLDEIESGRYISTSISVPYAVVNKFGLYSRKVLKYELHCDTTTQIDDIKDINITLTSTSAYSRMLNDMEQSEVTVKATGSGWANQKKKPNVVLVVDKSSFKINEQVAKESGLSISHQEPGQASGGSGGGGGGDGNKAGMIAGIVVGVVVVIAVVIVVVVVVMKKKKAQNSSNKDQEEA